MKKRIRRGLTFRYLALALVFVLALPAALPAAVPAPLRMVTAQAAVTQESRGFQIYQANFLMNNPGVRNDLSCQMLHHLLLQAIENDRTGELVDFQELVYLQQFLTDRDYRMDGWDNLLLEWPKKTIVLESLYQEVILEILYKQVTNDQNVEQQRREMNKRRSELLEMIGQALDWGEDFVQNDSMSRSLLQAALPQVGNALKEKLRMSAGESMSLSIVSSLLATADNVLDFVDSLALYYTLSDYNRGNLELLRTMYRQTQDVELMRALKSVITSLELLTEQNLLELVEKEKEDFSQGMASIALDTIYLACMGEVGLIAQTAASLTNLALNNQEIGTLYLMLLAQAGVEDALLEAIRYHWNQYSGSYEQAVTLNAGLKLMYDTYEYGNDLAAAYADAVLDDGLWNGLMNLIRGGNSTSDAFDGYVRTWQGLIDAGRTVFETAWELYLEEYPGVYTDFLEEAPVLVDGVRFTSEEPVIHWPDDTPHYVHAVVTPSDADNQGLTYHSMNENVLKVDPVTGLLTVVGPGAATIYAETREGGYRTSLTARVVDSREETSEETSQDEVSVETPEEEIVPESCYTENEDGVTLLQCFEYEKDNVPGDHVWHVPDTINGMPVTELSLSGQPYDLDGMTVICPESLLRIDDYCFQFSKLAEIRLNEGLVSIGDEAFYHCWNLDEIVFPSTLIEIGARAFSNDPLEEVTLPAGVREMGEDVFASSWLKTVRLADGFERLGEGAFRDCTRLGSVYFPDSLVEIGDSAFEECGLTFVDFENTKSLERIGDRAFFHCSGIEEIRFPDSLTQIGESAFSDCDDLKWVELPDTLSQIDRFAFLSCDSLRRVVCRSVSDRSPTMQGVVGEEAFAGCASLSLLELPAAIQVLEKDIVKHTPKLELLYWPDTLCAVAEQARHRDYESSADVRDYTALEIRVKDGIPGGSVQVQPLPDYLFICVGRVPPGGTPLLGDGDTMPSIYHPLLSYVELPSALAGELPMDTLGVMAQFGLLRLTAGVQIETVLPGKAFDAWEDFYHTDLASVSYEEEGQSVVIYQKPEESPYQKVSRAANENQADYERPFGEELAPVADQSVLGMRVRVNADADTAAGLNGEITVFGWIEESPESRIHDLEEFWSFEDVYLEQEEYFYCRIGTEDENGDLCFTLPGRYQLIFRVPDGFNRGRTALYHIGTDGIITRIGGELREGTEGTEFCAEVSDIGSYAFVSLDRMEITVEYSWLEELHDQYNESSRPVSNQPEIFQVGNSSVSVWIPDDDAAMESQEAIDSEEPIDSEASISSGEDAGQGADSKLLVFRPTLSQADSDLASLFDAGENDGEGESENPKADSNELDLETEQPEESGGLPDGFAGCLRLDAAEPVEEICFLASGGDMELTLYYVSIGESGLQTLTQVEAEAGEDANTGDVIYQAELAQEGSYYAVFTAREDNGESQDDSKWRELFQSETFLRVCRLGGILLILLLLFLICRKRRRRKKKRVRRMS